jgi:hypothetical protein
VGDPDQHQNLPSAWRKRRWRLAAPARTQRALI